MTETPSWLTAWRAERGLPPEPPPAAPQPPAQAEAPRRRRGSTPGNGLASTAGALRAKRDLPVHGPNILPPADGADTWGFKVPDRWPFDGCKRREWVLDLDFTPARKVRQVGWNRCLNCCLPFWSESVAYRRLCPRCGHYEE